MQSAIKSRLVVVDLDINKPHNLKLYRGKHLRLTAILTRIVTGVGLVDCSFLVTR